MEASSNISNIIIWYIVIKTFFYREELQSELLKNIPQWQASPTQSIPSQDAGGSGRGNGWISSPFTGEFISGNWNISMSVKATTSVNGQSGNFIYRIWTCLTDSGGNASLVTSSFITSSGVISLTTTPVNLTSSIILPRLNLHSEYIFIQMYWSITVAASGGGSTNADVNYVLGPDSTIQTSPFISSKSRIVAYND